ncbi:MAG: quinone-dependent dihydroorotate dehydrogenase [Rhodospirillaceae bacterium]|nr:quinone-dependent dihydroorotate dehydrogenase [Rhodospirillaceae bacterium]
MTDIHSLLLPLLRLLPPEAAHTLSIRGLKWGMGPKDRTPDDPVLATSVWGLDFRNPIGLSAGFDKGAEVPDAMLAAGFGFVEAGTVTPLPQPGNPKPRVFRLSEDSAVINRLSFNGTGLAPYVGRISKREKGLGPFGANIGKNKATEDGAADYEICVEAVAPYVDYLVANVSSPNTPGLRAMQGREILKDMLVRVLDARARAVPDVAKRPPLIVKIAPDLDDDERADIAAVILETGVDGMTVANTTVQRPDHMTDGQTQEAGGMSGAPLFPIALQIVGDMYRRTGGKVPIIGCGGVASGAEAYAMIRAGASLIQLYSALVYHGPALIPRIKRELETLLKRDGFAHISDAVGVDSRREN